MTGHVRERCRCWCRATDGRCGCDQAAATVGAHADGPFLPVLRRLCPGHHQSQGQPQASHRTRPVLHCQQAPLQLDVGARDRRDPLSD
jgi:hypothetical protein